MATRTLNRVMLIGNVGQEPRLTSTASGTPVATFSMATNRSWLPAGAAERREETQWHFIVCFGSLAEICGQILTQGTKVFVSGRIQTRIVNEEEKQVKKKEVVARNIIALDKRKREEEDVNVGQKKA